MNILFVSMVPFDSNTSATIQNKGIIKGLIELGHVVDIMTLKLNNNAISYDESMNDINSIVKNTYYISLNPYYAKFMARKPRNDNSNNKNSNRIMTKLKTGIRNIIKKVYDGISIYDAQKFNVRQVSKVKLDYTRYDVIISSSDPKSSHLIAEKIYKENRSCKAKWIQYWGDPMFIDITRKRDWRDKLVLYHEKRLIRQADKVVYASPLTLKIQKEIFPKYAYKMDYANQVYANLNKNIAILEKKSNNNKVTVGYFGAYKSDVRNILPLYNAAKVGSFNLYICGHSDLNLKSTTNIQVHGAVSYKEAINMEEKCDILVCICNSKGTQIPGKIYYCAGYNKPIIIVLDGEYKKELKEYFETFNRYILCENNEDSILKAFTEAKAQIGKQQYIINEQLTPEYMAYKILQ